MRASIVVITKNQSPFLSRSLPVLCAQRISGGFEIIVVDSGSTDGALDVVRRFPVRLIEIPAVSFGYSLAYNTGMRLAAGEFLVRLSGDALPTNHDWLDNLLRPFDLEDVCAVWSRQVAPPGLRNRFEHLLNRVYYSPHRPLTVYRRAVTVLGGNMAVRRDLWQRIPFDERLPQAEDFAWLRYWCKQGKAGVYTPDAPVVHGHEEPLPTTLHRSFYQTYLQALICAGRIGTAAR